MVIHAGAARHGPTSGRHPPRAAMLVVIRVLPTSIHRDRPQTACMEAVSACSSQKRMSISRYSVVRIGIPTVSRFAGGLKRVLGWPAGAGEAVGMRAWGQSRVGQHVDRRVSVTVSGGPDKGWPASPWEGLGTQRGEAALGYQLTRWSKTNSGAGAGASSGLALRSGA